ATGAGNHTLKIVISENGWTAPAGNPLNVSTSAGGSTGGPGGTTVNASNQAFLDTSNTLATTATPGGTAVPASPATASATSPGTGTNPLLYNPSPAVSLVPGSSLWTLTNMLTFSSTNWQVGSTANVSSSVTVTPAAVPVPAGLVLALTGLPCLGL